MTRSVPVLAAVVVAVVVACSPKEPDRSCPSGQERCDNQCVDPATYYVTEVNCGACGVSCGPGACAGDSCDCGALASCPDSNPRCADLQSDRLNCGGCGQSCTVANETCSTGTCQCRAPFTACSPTVCTNLLTDARNCSACGNACPATKVCSGGSCVCPPTLPDPCGSTCVNWQSDPANCGGCGQACPAGATCSNGGCVCPGGESECGGACVDTRTNEANCGACGRACGFAVACCASTCCAGGLSCCGDGACQTQHSNGVGQSFFDCAPLGTYDQTQALKAARAWRSSGTLVPGNGIFCGSMACIGWQTADACGTWCYGQDAWQGRVTVNTQNNVCLCPPDGSAHWN